MFDCYRTQRMVRAGVVNYDGCFVDTTKGEKSMCMSRGISWRAESVESESAEISLKSVNWFAGDMSIRTGTLTVGVAGVYQISFTAKYVSSSKGRFGAWSDIYVNDTVSGRVGNPPRHWSIFNPCQATSLKGKSRFKLPYFGCQLGCHFLRSVLKVFLKPWGHRLV